jgi:hypothetical protein
MLQIQIGKLDVKRGLSFLYGPSRSDFLEGEISHYRYPRKSRKKKDIHACLTLFVGPTIIIGRVHCTVVWHELCYIDGQLGDYGAERPAHQLN